jgi:hypothetical protein
VKFTLGFILGVALGNPVWHAVESRLPSSVHEKMIDSLERINERIVAYGESLQHKIQEKENNK